MPHRILWFACALLASTASGQHAPRSSDSAAPAVKIDTAQFTVVNVTRDSTTLPVILAREIKKAQARHRTPVVEFWAPWCGPCRSLAASLGDHRMVDAFRGIYLIRLNLDEWRDNVTGTKLPGDMAIPAFFALTHDSTTTGETIDGGAWGDDIPENMAPPLKKYFTSVIAHFADSTKTHQKSG